MGNTIGRRRRWGAACALLAFSVVYCLPAHPSAGRAWGLDVLAHVGVFAGLAWGSARGLGGGRALLVGLIVLGAGLEGLQWWLGRYPRLEWLDLAANVAGVGLGWGVAVARRRGADGGGA